MEVPQVIVKQEEVNNFTLATESDEKYEPLLHCLDIKTKPLSDVSEFGHQEYELDLPKNVQIIKGNDSEMLDSFATKTSSGGILRDYYTKIKGRKVVSCNLCQKKVSFKRSSLRTHLKIKHMRKYKTLTTRKFGKQGRRNAFGRLQRQCGAKKAIRSTGTAPVTSVDRHTRRFGRLRRKKAYERLQQWCGAKKAVESAATAPETSMDRPSSARALSLEEKKTIDGMLIKMIAKGYHPTYMVEGAGFHDFVRALNPNYEMPDKKTIGEYYRTIYNKVKAERRQLIKEEATDICITVDYWTSRTRDRIMTVTAHFITNKFELKHVMFICDLFASTRANGLDITQALELVEDRNITSYITEHISFVTDTTISNIKRYECLGHKLYLCLQKATMALKDTIDKLVNFICYVPRYFVKLFEYKTKKLDLFSVVSWDYVYHLIESITRNENVVCRARISSITDEEWTALTQFATIFKPFRQATRELCTEKFVSASKAIAVITGLQNVLSDVIGNKPEMYDSIREVMKILQSEMDEHFGDIEDDEDITLCAALDPRYKLDIFDDDVKKRIYKDLVRKVGGVVRAQKSPNTTTEPAGGEEAGDTDVLDLWGLLKQSKKLRQRDSVYTECAVLARQEVDGYLGDESGSKQRDPCDWWKNNADKYPNLSVLFRSSWQRRATSVPGKDVFFRDFASEARRNDLAASESMILAFLNANSEDADYQKYM